MSLVCIALFNICEIVLFNKLKIKWHHRQIKNHYKKSKLYPIEKDADDRFNGNINKDFRIYHLNQAQHHKDEVRKIINNS